MIGSRLRATRARAWIRAREDKSTATESTPTSTSSRDAHGEPRRAAAVAVGEGELAARRDSCADARGRVTGLRTLRIQAAPTARSPAHGSTSAADPEARVRSLPSRSPRVGEHASPERQCAERSFRHSGRPRTRRRYRCERPRRCAAPVAWSERPADRGRPHGRRGRRDRCRVHARLRRGRLRRLRSRGRG